MFKQHAIPLSQQLEYYKEYQSKLAQIVSSSKAHDIINSSLYIVSSGASDYVQNYYINPYLNKFQSADDFANLLIGIFDSFIKVLYISLLLKLQNLVVASYSIVHHGTIIQQLNFFPQK